MNNNYLQSSLKGLLPGRRWLFFLSLIFLTTNVFGQARNYQFGQSSAAYTEITGGTTSTAIEDDGTEVLALPFPFTYAGTAVTEITVSTNGFVRMAGGAVFGSSWTNTIESTASLPVLAPFWDDHHLVAASGTIVYATTGTAPNRQFSIEFRDVVTSGSGSTTATSRARFKVTLFETSNQIVYHYGTSSATTTLSGSIGMNSAPGGAGQFLSVVPGVVATVSTSIPVNNLVTLPDSGVVYTFTPSPASCGMPWAIASSAITQTGFSLNWRNAGSTSYQYVASTSPNVPTGAGTAVADTFVTVTGLASSTAYYVHVRSVCTGGTNSAWAGPIVVTTGGPVSSVASGLWSNPGIWSTGSVPISSSSVTVSAGDSVIFDVATSSVFSLTVNGVLGVNATAARTLSVAGDVSVAASGSLNFGVPTTGTALRILELTGNFTNAGTSNMASGNAAIRFLGTTAQTYTNSGTLTNNAVGQLIISNAAGVTLASPVTIGFNLDLVAGVLNAGTNLTFDQVAVNTTSSQVRRSPLGSLVGTPTITSTVYNVQYVFFTGQTSALITEGPEIPASRTINALTISNIAGLNLTGNLTLTAATSALVLTNGVITLPAGGKIICSNSGFAPTVGSATSFVNGGFEVVVNSATAVTRNFPVGSVVDGVPVRGHVVIASMITGTATPQSVLVTPVGAPSGTGVSPMGPRAFRITSTGSIGTTATVALNWDARDALSFAGSLANIRVIQATALTGSAWTARSASGTAGSLTGTGTRTTSAINLSNGNFFAWGTVSTGDVAVTNITSPVSGACFGQAENVVAVLRNDGASINRATTPITVKGTVTTPGGTVINLTNVVRNAGTFGLAQFDTVVFTDALNMVDSGNYVVRVFIDSLTASVRTNDTITRTIRSDAWSARANPSQIITSQSSTVEVLRNGVVASQAGVLPRSTAAVRISEMVAFRTGGGAQPIYPAYVPAAAADFLEFTNFGDTAANIGGWNLEIFGVGARTYAFPAGTVVPAGGVLVLHIGPGTDDVANAYYNTGGTNDGISSTSLWGVTLRNGTTLVDAVAFRGFVFPAAANVSAADWSGNSSTTSSAGMMLVNFDNNNASNWVISTASLFTNIGAFNPNMSVVSRNVSWTGPGGFTATGFSAPTGVRNTAAVEQYTATITSAASCVRTAAASLQVMLPITPVAGFTRSSNTATMGGVVTTVTLTDTSLNIPFQRRWTITPNTFNYVNSTNDSSVAPQVQFTAVGSYAVKLVVSNPAGADSITVNNAVTVTLGYCASNATSTADTKIDSVMLGTALTG
ncbi:MAG: lamin tail domain-containing protein, partial [Sphingobacteriaceae bacterium]|nr:lamin tail domain-containing protein [Sphingobacteriaceae bacterium]